MGAAPLAPAPLATAAEAAELPVSGHQSDFLPHFALLLSKTMAKSKKKPQKQREAKAAAPAVEEVEAAMFGGETSSDEEPEPAREPSPPPAPPLTGWEELEQPQDVQQIAGAYAGCYAAYMEPGMPGRRAPRRRAQKHATHAPPPPPARAPPHLPRALAPPAEPVQAPERPKLSKHAKKRKREDHERDVRAAELARLQGDAAPGSVAEFEQAVLSAPSSSFLWIKYFAFLISLGELDRARTLADRALTTISYRRAGRAGGAGPAGGSGHCEWAGPSRPPARAQGGGREVQRVGGLPEHGEPVRV